MPRCFRDSTSRQFPQVGQKRIAEEHMKRMKADRREVTRKREERQSERIFCLLRRLASQRRQIRRKIRDTERQEARRIVISFSVFTRARFQWITSARHLISPKSESNRAKRSKFQQGRERGKAEVTLLAVRCWVSSAEDKSVNMSHVIRESGLINQDVSWLCLVIFHYNQSKRFTTTRSRKPKLGWCWMMSRSRWWIGISGLWVERTWMKQRWEEDNDWR